MRCDDYNIYAYEAYLLECAVKYKNAAAHPVRKNGTLFVIRPKKMLRSPLDVPGVDVEISATEIVEILREGRERSYGLPEK